MNKLSRCLPILALLALAVAPLPAADLASATVTVPAAEAPRSTDQQISSAQALPDWMKPQTPIQSQTGSCSARTHCYAYPFATLSCTGEFDCYASNGCYIYCDGYEYDCPPYYMCP